jgi:hypothetical protein
MSYVVHSANVSETYQNVPRICTGYVFVRRNKHVGVTRLSNVAETSVHVTRTCVFVRRDYDVVCRTFCEHSGNVPERVLIMYRLRVCET